MLKKLQQLLAPKPGRKSDDILTVYRNWAVRAMGQERWSAAEIFLDRMLEVSPASTEAWLMKGHVRHHCVGDGDKALEFYKKVIYLCGVDSAHPHATDARRGIDTLVSRWG